MVGAPDKPLPVSVFGLIFGRRSFSGSPIGGLPETQEMLDFCGKHNLTADVEVIPIQKINEVELTADDLNSIKAALANVTIQGDRYPAHLQQRVGR